MDFAVMGTISSYIKQKNLSFATKHKIKTGQSLTDAKGNLVSLNTTTFNKMCETNKTSTDQIKQQKVRRIKQKLKSGQKLSDTELGFLRVNDPSAYKKAKHAEEAREELKSELKKAKSKAEAREAITRAMVKASADAMSELGALAQGGGGLNVQNAGGGEMSSSGQVSDGQMSSTAEGNFSSSAGGSENQSFTDANQSIQETGDHATGEISETNLANHDGETDKKLFDQKNSDDGALTYEDIMEKYIWTIRALQNEWLSFVDSKSYKDLPEQVVDEVLDKEEKYHHHKVTEPDRKTIDAATAYRKAMNLM